VLAAATEISNRIAAPGFLEQVRASSAALRDAASRGPIAGVRGAGLLLGLVVKPEVTAASVRDGLLEQNVLVGTSDDPKVLRLSPPLVFEPRDAQRLADALDALEVKA
jgi:acetylornithine/N-succinyldiaminopimelate aminotransferase